MSFDWSEIRYRRYKRKLSKDKRGQRWPYHCTADKPVITANDAIAANYAASDYNIKTDAAVSSDNSDQGVIISASFATIATNKSIVAYDNAAHDEPACVNSTDFGSINSDNINLLYNLS